MRSYKLAHIDPQGPGDSRPTALQIVKDEQLENKLRGKVIVITGASSGIGLETARALSATGALLLLTTRDVKKATTALAGILQPGRVTLIEMDNTSFHSVRLAATSILNMTNGNVNILINNAGVMALPDLQLTGDGNEMQFGTNHLAHFLLFHQLKHALLASSTPDFHSRVVNVSSSGHRLCSINESDNYNFQKGDYNPWVAYGQSKTANIYMTSEIDRRYAKKGLRATSVHPGAVITPLLRHMDPHLVAQNTMNKEWMKLAKSPEQGAATSVMAAVGKAWENNGGKYLVDCHEAEPGPDDGDIGGLGYVSHTYAPDRAAILWRDSLSIIGVKSE